MRVVYKKINQPETRLIQSISITQSEDLMTLRTISNPLKAIYSAVETCIIRQLYPENFQFHA